MPEPLTIYELHGPAMTKNNCLLGDGVRVVLASEVEQLERDYATSLASHELTRDGAIQLRQDYDRLHRQFTELQQELDRWYAVHEGEKQALQQHLDKAHTDSATLRELVKKLRSRRQLAQEEIDLLATCFEPSHAALAPDREKEEGHESKTV